MTQLEKLTGKTRRDMIDELFLAAYDAYESNLYNRLWDLIYKEGNTFELRKEMFELWGIAVKEWQLVESI